jgi:hypothetical protein
VAIDGVVFTVELLNATGSVVRSEEGYTEVVTLASGSDSPFTVYFERVAGVTRVRIAAIEYNEPATEAPITGLIVSLNLGFIDEFGGYAVTGKVTNASGVTYLDVTPIVALYDGAGNVIRVDYTFLDVPELASGESALFEIFFDPAPPAVASARAWVEGVRE